MRTFKFFSVVLLVAMLLSACSGGGAKTLKIAVLAPLSGPVPTFGVSTRDGALLAIKQWNAAGGVLGMQIQAIVEDSQCTPDPAVNAANKSGRPSTAYAIVFMAIARCRLSNWTWPSRS